MSIKYDTRLCWLSFLGEDVPAFTGTPYETALAELAAGLRALGLPGIAGAELLPGWNERFEISRDGERYAVRGGETGVLYGVYCLLMRLAAKEDPVISGKDPAFRLRMIDHWDNMTGKVERGYAGDSLFFRKGLFSYDKSRLRLYARLLASVGINTICLNNVNVVPPADGLLSEEFLPELKKVTDLMRPFGIRLLVAADYAMPASRGPDTADPLDERVQDWWTRQAGIIYSYIPDLRGFLIKADSEFRPGPFTYGRSHAEGANMLARTLKPHGGEVIWRCFVYNCRQDWRDTKTDRPKAAYDNYVPLDGQFDDNVILQIKYGPYDFQVREPVSPLFYAMPRTEKALELQLAQEYTGQQIDLYYMLPQWLEILKDLEGSMPGSAAAVANVGSDDNFTGHDLAQANLYAYGRLAYDGMADTQALTEEWIRLSLSDDPETVKTVCGMLLSSREIYENYTAPLGLCWMVTPHTHYGPSPEGYEYSAWGTYLRADRDAVGIDRTPNGTGFTQQYPEALANGYADIDTCPEKLLLFFHRVRYDRVLKSGKALIQTIYDRHFEGAEQAKGLLAAWETLEGKVPAAAYDNVRSRLERQVKNAREWRDVVNTYFRRYSGIEDVNRRLIYS